MDLFENQTIHEQNLTMYFQGKKKEKRKDSCESSLLIETLSELTFTHTNALFLTEQICTEFQELTFEIRIASL